MRDIIFRGQTFDGEWVEGSLHREYGETTKGGERKIDYRILGMRGECRYIIPETVGQYTGLPDKNGKKIFEGDILSVTVNEMENEDKEIVNDLINMGIYTEADKTRMHKFPTGNKTKTVWSVEHKNHFNQGIGFYIYGKNRRFHLKLSKSTLLNVNAEVIGNIHDNPELLKGGADE